MRAVQKSKVLGMAAAAYWPGFALVRAGGFWRQPPARVMGANYEKNKKASRMTER